jgi:hypothetical protein
MQATDRDHRENAERKWLMLQKTGLSLLFLAPFAILGAALTTDGVWVGIVFLLMTVAGFSCLRFGRGRLEAIARNTQK